MKSIICNNSYPIVVSAHYKEDISWVQSIKYPAVVYSKTNQNLNFIPFNKVQEVPAYLKYIIDNYKCLPMYSIFVHGHLDSMHQYASISNTINSLKFIGNIINLNRSDWVGNVSKIEEDLGINEYPKYKWLSDNWKDIFGNHLDLPDKLTFYSCAQFAITRDCILRHPLKFWQQLYDWCKSNSLDNFVSSRIFEYTWYYIFSGQNLYVKDLELSL